MSGNNPIHISGKGVSVFLGVISLIFTFVPDTGIGFFGRLGLFILGGILILLGVNK